MEFFSLSFIDNFSILKYSKHVTFTIKNTTEVNVLRVFPYDKFKFLEVYLVKKYITYE